jgi:hypothetical protein
LIARWLAIALSLVAPPSVAAEARGPDFAVGQIWSYKHRAIDEHSLLRIAVIEEGAVGRIFHVSLTGVKLTCQSSPTAIAHLPVSETTLRQSLTALAVASAEFPDAAAGITEWRTAEGGVFTISVTEIVDMLEKSICGQAS